MQKKALEWIRRYHMFEQGGRVIVGLSGGADSVCLLQVLKTLEEELRIELEAVHVHHGLRGDEADRDAAYAEELSGLLGVPFLLVRVDAAAYARQEGLSVEEAGRLLRYETFEKEADRWGADWIAVAHHADDNAETILHHLFRGTGLKGLSGIAPVRGRIVRPLLGCGREEILGYLQETGRTYCEDSTNALTDYTRNRLRHQIIPLIRETVNQAAVEHVLQAGRLAGEADAYLKKQAERFLGAESVSAPAAPAENGASAAMVPAEESVSAPAAPAEIGVPAAAFLAEESIIRRYVVSAMTERLSGTRKDFSSAHIEAVCGLAEKPVGHSVDLPYGLEAVKTYDTLWIRKKKACVSVDQPVCGRNFASTAPGKGGETENPAADFDFKRFSYEKGAEIPKNQYTKWFDYDKIKGTLAVRRRREGDYMLLPSGGRKTVKSYMIDAKIPKARRDHIYVLAEGSHVLWVVGYRISEYYKITEDTATVLQVKFDGGKDNG